MIMVIRSKKELEEKLEAGFYLVKKKDRWYVQKRLPGNKYITEIVDRSLDDYCEEIRGLKTAEAIAQKTEEKIAKKISESTVKQVVKAIDLRTKWIMEWGTWVENNLLPYADGKTFEEKAQFVLEMLDELKRSYPEFLKIQERIRKLEAENRVLKDLINSLINKVNAFTAIKEALKTAVANGSDPEVINLLLNKLVELGGAIKWSGLTRS